MVEVLKMLVEQLASQAMKALMVSLKKIVLVSTSFIFRPNVGKTL